MQPHADQALQPNSGGFVQNVSRTASVIAPAIRVWTGAVSRPPHAQSVSQPRRDAGPKRVDERPTGEAREDRGRQAPVSSISLTSRETTERSQSRPRQHARTPLQDSRWIPGSWTTRKGSHTGSAISRRGCGIWFPARRRSSIRPYPMAALPNQKQAAPDHAGMPYPGHQSDC